MGHSVRIGLLGLLALAGGSGCATCPAGVQSALKQPAPDRTATAARDYTIACPDVLTVSIAGRQPVNLAVESDGCVSARGIGRVRVDGATTGEAANLLARAGGWSADQLALSVSEYASRHVLIFGPGTGVQQVVPYIGPETVTDVLRRTGGLAPGAAYRAIHVVRPHVAGGHRPELFVVDLEAILSKRDPATDIHLEPYDQIYIGETRGSSVARCLPPWLRQMFSGVSSLDGPAELPKE